MAPTLQFSGLQAQEKQLSQLGDQNVTLKEEMADLKSRLVFVCLWSDVAVLYPGQTHSSVTTCTWVLLVSSSRKQRFCLIKKVTQ